MPSQSEEKKDEKKEEEEDEGIDAERAAFLEEEKRRKGLKKSKRAAGDKAKATGSDLKNPMMDLPPVTLQKGKIDSSLRHAETENLKEMSKAIMKGHVPDYSGLESAEEEKKEKKEEEELSMRQLMQ